MRADLTRIQVELVLANLAEHFDDDERLKLDTLAGETDLFELASKLLAANEDDEGTKASLAEQIDVRKLRSDRVAKRIAGRRDAITSLMECAGLDKLPLPEATVSLRRLAPKAIVTDADALPDAFVSIVRKPDLSAIRAANENGAIIPGVALDNGGTSITVRRK